MANSALEWTGVALHLLLYCNYYSKPGIRAISCNTEKEKREKFKINSLTLSGQDRKSVV